MSTYNHCVRGQELDQAPELTKAILRQNVTPGTVLLLCPGGIENGGGIGRQMGYFLKEHERKGSRPAYKIIDTRGPRFLDGSVLYTCLAVGYFVVSLLTSILQVVAVLYAN